MQLSVQFTPITADEIPEVSNSRKQDGSRFVQILAVNTDAGIDLVYSFMKDGVLTNYKVQGVSKEQEIPSITDNFLAAFVFENEIHDLFGVHIKGIAIDFAGKFYDLAQNEPMTIISPAQKAAREKAAKLAAAKAERARKASAANASYAESHPQAKAKAASPITPDAMSDLESKMTGADPEKIARVKAALAAKAKRAADEAAQKEAERADRLASLDPEKAARVKAALEAKQKRQAAQPGLSNVQEEAELDAKLAQLDPERAAKVIAAMDAKDKAHQAAAASQQIEQQRAAMEEKLKGMDPERAAKVRAAFEAKVAKAKPANNQKGGE